MKDIMCKTQLPTEDVEGMATQLVATNSGVVQKRAERSGGYCLMASPQGEEVDIKKWMSDMRQVLLWSQSYGDILVQRNNKRTLLANQTRQTPNMVSVLRLFCLLMEGSRYLCTVRNNCLERSHFFCKENGLQTCQLSWSK